MRHTAGTLKNSTLNTNLNELAHAFIRELAMAARKVSIYGGNHQVAERALERPFLICGQIFAFKKYINLNLHKGDLSVLNIILKESVFTADIIRFMQILDLNSILLHDAVTFTEFSKFVNRIVKRANASDSGSQVAAWLTENNISTVEVNSELGIEFFENNRVYRGDVVTDFSVRGMAMQQLGDDLKRLAVISLRGEEALPEFQIDFHIDIVNYVIPEKVALFSSHLVCRTLTELSGKEDAIDVYQAICKLIEYHPDREQIANELESSAANCELGHQVVEELIRPTGMIQIESSRKLDALTEDIFSDTENLSVSSEESNNFADCFTRLLKTGQREKAVYKMNQLTDMLSAPDPGFRQKALALLTCSIAELHSETDIIVLEKVSDYVVRKISNRKETYEYSDFIWRLLENNLVHRRFDLMVALTSAMAQRRKVEEEVTVYDSMAIKQVFANLNRREVLGRLVDELVRADYGVASLLKEIFVNIGSEEVALALTEIITHPERTVRQHALKTLSEMGNPALKICSQILNDDTVFERDNNRLELHDSKWYVIRNAIFVLGLIKDQAAIWALRLRFNDTDIRVRREIVTALEKIGGEDACDLLVLMAADPVKEIRERSVITVGLIGTEESVPLLADVACSTPSLAIHAVTAVGKLGGEEALSFLGSLLEDEGKLSSLAGGQVHREDLRLAVVKALGTIGNAQSITRLKRYRESIPAAQRLFFKNSQVNKTISEILARH
ncbi:MAG: HEAT repeat domain-containing protein [bacterium]|nr:HEAT repeat domain-containing protein [bacterium]